MDQIVFASDAEGGPAGIGDPMMFLRKAFVQQGVTHGARKRNVKGAIGVQVAEFGVANAKLVAAEAVRMHGDVRPGRNERFELLQRVCHGGLVL